MDAVTLFVYGLILGYFWFPVWKEAKEIFINAHKVTKGIKK